MSFLLPEFKDFKLAHHGAIDFNELRSLNLEASDIDDFSVNSLPYGPVESVLDAVNNSRLDQYPDRECLMLRERVAHMDSVGMSNVLIGNGSSELLDLIASAVLKRGDHVLIVGPTYGEYERSARRQGAEPMQINAESETNFDIPFVQVRRCLQSAPCKVLYCCRPNNPTGELFDYDALIGLIDEFDQTLFVVDEAYIRFLSDMRSIVPESIHRPNLIVVRSMTKDFALAGLRLGYMVAHDGLIGGMNRLKTPWSVSGVAQAAGIAAIDNLSEYEQLWSALSLEASEFKQRITNLGFNIHNSRMHYFLVRTDRALKLREYLLKECLLVRLCASFGLHNWLRVSTQTASMNQRFIDVIGSFDD
ncbi:MAG: histidinol-phosphate transaminase [Pseudomonadota bacterium]